MSSSAGPNTWSCIGADLYHPYSASLQPHVQSEEQKFPRLANAIHMLACSCIQEEDDGVSFHAAAFLLQSRLVVHIAPFGETIRQRCVAKFGQPVEIC